MLTEIEAAIVARLTAALVSNPVRLRAFPERPAELGQPLPRGQVLVGYKKSSFNLQSRAPITLEMLSTWQISVQVTNLRTHTGVYPLLDTIRSGLLGFNPIAGPSTGFHPVAESFSDLDDGVWYYDQDWALPLLIVEGEELYTTPTTPPAQAPPYLPGYTPTPWGLVRITAGLWRAGVGILPEEATQLDRTFNITP